MVIIIQTKNCGNIYCRQLKCVLCEHTPNSIFMSGMYILSTHRLYLSGLHYNENAGRTLKMGRDGEPQHKLYMPKVRLGEFRAKEVKVDPTFGTFFISKK